jgi:hypothetical protein
LNILIIFTDVVDDEPAFAFNCPVASISKVLALNFTDIAGGVVVDIVIPDPAIGLLAILA